VVVVHLCIPAGRKMTFLFDKGRKKKSDAGLHGLQVSVPWICGP